MHGRYNYSVLHFLARATMRVLNAPATINVLTLLVSRHLYFSGYLAVIIESPLVLSLERVSSPPSFVGTVENLNEKVGTYVKTS
jgi:hypothetical protein